MYLSRQLADSMAKNDGKGKGKGKEILKKPMVVIQIFSDLDFSSTPSSPAPCPQMLLH